MTTTPATAPQILIRNVDVFDGDSDELLRGVDVLVEGQLVKEIGTGLSADAAG